MLGGLQVERSPTLYKWRNSRAVHRQQSLRCARGVCGSCLDLFSLAHSQFVLARYAEYRPAALYSNHARQPPQTIMQYAPKRRPNLDPDCLTSRPD
jgi:hypothetical protein